MNKLPKRKFVALLSLVATTSLIAVNGKAQTTAATTTTPAANQNPQVLEKLVVTGSYLPPAGNSIAIPVIGVNTTAIENSGTNNVLEILRKTVPQFSGNANLGSTNANIASSYTQGGSQVALRNTATLVLINGRRMAYSPVDAQGGYQFVDVNMIPVAAIERIEVLADGASAIYGSDAVSGVVNIILKTNYSGVEAGARYGWTTNQGHAAERSAHIVAGGGNDRTSVTVSAEWLKQDPIFNYERPYSAVTYGTPTFAGSVNVSGTGAVYYYLDPSKNAPTVTPGGLSPAALVANGTYKGPYTAAQMFELFNLSQYVTQTTENERQSMTAAIEHHVGDNLRFFGDFMYSQTNTFSQINGQPIGGGIPAAQYGNPFNVPVTARNRLLGHPREYLNDTSGIRGVVGVHHNINADWDWEAAASYSRIKQDYSNPGVINNAKLDAAVESGQFNFFARNQAAGVLETSGIVGTATGSFLSTLRSVDIRTTGKLFELPAGTLDLALGAEQRKEGLSGTADPLSQLDPVTGELGWNGATTLYPFDANRNIGAFFGEIRVPVAKDVPGIHYLEVSGAIRHEMYSDTSNPTVPKITARYLPFNDELAFRGTYSKSFSAPQLFQLFGPVSVGFTDSFSLKTVGGDVIDDLQTNYMSGANPGLQPSRSENYTLGFVYSPKAVKGLSLSVDYWHIRQKDLVTTIPSSTMLQSVETNGTASPYVSNVHFGSFTGPNPTGAGQIGIAVPDDVYLVSPLVNIASQKLDGWDVAAKYTYKPEGIGRFDFASNIGVYNHYTHVDVPGEATQETVGKSTTFNGTIPRWQAYTTVDFQRDNYSAFVGWRAIAAVTDDEDNNHVGQFNSFDASVSYTLGNNVRYLSGAKVTVGCNNVFNRFGPLDPTVFSDANVDIATYGAMGRFLYVDVKFKF